MKKLLLLSVLLIFTCSSGLFAQDYMKLSKKKLRIEHQKKVDLIDTLTMDIDTLNSLNRELKSNLLIAKTDLKKKNDFINDLKFKLIQNEKDTSRLEREIQMINDSILELKNKILQKNVSNPLDGLRNSSNFETFLSYFLLTTYSEKNIDSLIANVFMAQVATERTIPLIILLIFPCFWVGFFWIYHFQRYILCKRIKKNYEQLNKKRINI